ncbi:hypothetical protein [Geomonas azotofigens]|uniref:hypothetical protein n=1 Tax=Geomonas azotofigens TaxID=2843196 RepID=UPI001C10BC91|nr:hypothetical protein [Geomonas azotofigens]MBU5612870.1 hypothetical protein [Geomonas azotofigens]
MGKLVFCLGIVLLASPVLAGSYDNYEIKQDPYGYGRSYGGSREIEMKNKYDYDPSNKYRGEIESDGTVRMKNYNGDRLRGTIDNDGYGTLRDQNGNTYRVRPR